MLYLERVVIIGVLMLGGCTWQGVKDGSKKVANVVLAGLANANAPQPPQTFHRRGNYICDQNEICVGGNQIR